MAQCATFTLVVVVVAMGIEQAGVADSGVAAFDADADPLVFAGGHFDAGAVVTPVGVASATELAVVDLLVALAQLLRSAAHIVPTGADVLVAFQVAVADRTVLAALKTHLITARGDAAVAATAIVVVMAVAKLGHTALPLVAHAGGACALAVA